MDAQELAVAQARLQRGDGLAKDVRGRADVQADVVAGRFGPIDFPRFQADDLTVSLDDDALRRVLPRVEFGEQVEYAALEHGLGGMLELLAGVAERLRQAVFGDR